jgi:hypothetical protein
LKINLDSSSLHVRKCSPSPSAFGANSMAIYGALIDYLLISGPGSGLE